MLCQFSKEKKVPLLFTFHGVNLRLNAEDEASTPYVFIYYIIPKEILVTLSCLDCYNSNKIESWKITLLVKVVKCDLILFNIDIYYINSDAKTALK